MFQVVFLPVLVFSAFVINQAGGRAAPSTSTVTTDAGFRLERRELLDPSKGSRVCLSWGRSEQDPSTMYFQVEAETKGWVGIGFNDEGSMKGADMVVGWIDAAGKANFEDRHGVSEYSAPEKDIESNVRLLAAYENATHTVFQWSRQMDTKDSNKQDYVLTDKPVEVLWAYTEKDPDSGIPGHHDARGHMKLALLGAKNQSG